MSTYSLSHLSDQALLADLAGLVAADRQTTAALLAHIAEVEARRLHLPAACSSMHVYCMRVLHLAEDVAFKRIRAARAARRFPQIFVAIAEGRLHITGVVLLAPHLTDDNASELLAAAAHKSKAEIELLLARYAPRPDLEPKIDPLPPPAPSAPGQVDPDPPAPPPAATKVTPLAPERFALQLTIDQATRDKLVRAQALLRHRLPSGDLAQVIDRALDALLSGLEREKFGATTRPHAGKAPGAEADPRYVPNEVRRAVHARDGEQCSFVSEDGVRCTERGFLERDHRNPVVLGGQPTAQNIRMMCRPHNAYEADRILGASFRQTRRSKAGIAPVRPAVPTPVSSSVPPATPDPAAASPSKLESDTQLALHGLGFTKHQARTAVATTAHLPASTLEQRIRTALAVLHPDYGKRCSEASAVRWQTGAPDASAAL